MYICDDVYFFFLRFRGMSFYFVAKKAWQQALRDITHNNKAANVCPTTSLMKQ